MESRRRQSVADVAGPDSRAAITGAWAARFASEDQHAVALLRLMPGVEALQADSDLWLRGREISPELAELLTKSAPAELFSVNESGALTPAGRRLPTRTLPAGKWQPISDLFQPTIVSAAMPAVRLRRARLTLVRSSNERVANLMIAASKDWAAWADTAPVIRLTRLGFAASDDAVMIRGEPLPPIPGPRFAEQQGVAVPCGFSFSPAVDADSLRQLLKLRADDLAVFHEDGRYDVVASAAFVRASRPAVLATFEPAEEGAA